MSTTEARRRYFRAPWGWTLWILTVAAGGGAAIGFAVSGALWVRLLLGGVLLVTVAFSVRGYSVRDGQVLVHRVGWATRLDLANLHRIEHAPGIMRGSIRTFGTGGLFGFVGHFRNDALGSYRAYATKRDHAVVLHMADGPVVVTPEAPDAFVEAVTAERDART
jgi:hypothetical protein